MLTIRNLYQLLSSFEALRQFQEDNVFASPAGFGEKRAEIFNYIDTFHWSPLFKEMGGPKRLQELANAHGIALKNNP